MVRSLALLACLALVSACGSNRAQRRLSFAEMQAINPGVTADWVLTEYPFARDMRRGPNGCVSQLGYPVVDPQNKSRSVLFLFDEHGVMRQKSYSGPYVRPPVKVDKEGQPCR